MRMKSWQKSGLASHGPKDNPGAVISELPAGDISALVIGITWHE
jgi:hypothetical protein